MDELQAKIVKLRAMAERFRKGGHLGSQQMALALALYHERLAQPERVDLDPFGTEGWETIA